VRGFDTVVVFDKDSCLFRTQQRWGLIPTRNPESSWEDYSRACGGDEPIHGTIAAARLHWRWHQVHICSAANDAAEPEIRRLLDTHHVPFDGLKLRERGDDRSGPDLKVAYIQALRAQGLEVVLFYEDYRDCATTIERETGVPVVGVNPFYDDDVSGLRHTDRLDATGGGL
jgi:hypothetical protein